MDIEDLSNEFSPIIRPNGIAVKARFKSNKLHCKTDDLLLNSDIPEKFHVFVQTWGCAHNTSDSEYMAGLLAQYGYQVSLGGAKNPAIDSDLHNNDERVSECAGHNDDDDNHCCDANATSESMNSHTSDCDTQNVVAVKNDSTSECNGDSNDNCCCRRSTNESNKSKNPDMQARLDAHIWVLNSCTVKGPAEDHFRNAVVDGLNMGKRVVVAGCVPQSRPNLDYLKNISVIGVQQIDRIVEVVEETLKGNVVRFLDKKWTNSEDANEQRRLGGASLDLPKIRRNPLIEILAISTGCLNACTYCKTKHARGVLGSYPIDELLNRVRQAFDDGVKELWLTSEDLGAYGRDLTRNLSSSYESTSVLAEKWPNHLTLADLLINLVPLIPPSCMLRLGMTNPPYILDQLDIISNILQHPRVYSFLHIPVQSGSDAVLSAMRREYTVEEFSRVVDYLQEHVKLPSLLSKKDSDSTEGCGKLTIATDLICGFPNETEDDFQLTVNLVKKYQFPVLFINQFYARPGTPAANMIRKSTTSEVKKRTRLLHDLFRTYRPFAGREGCEVLVLVTETSFDGNYWIGHTKSYEQVLLPKRPNIYGQIVLVRITECDKFFMRGTILDEGPFQSLLLDEHARTDLDSIITNGNKCLLNSSKQTGLVRQTSLIVKKFYSSIARENCFTRLINKNYGIICLAISAGLFCTIVKIKYFKN